jgi:Do/DeqQ family serine protease
MMKTKSSKAMLALVMCCAILMALPVQGWSAAGTVLREFENSFVEIAEMASPSVVHITAEKKLPEKMRDRISEKEFFEMFPDIDPQLKEKIPHEFFFKLIPPDAFPDMLPAGGSGVLIDKEGYILTNNHLVENTGKITVRITSHNGDKGKEYEARMVGRDTATDLAVIKINPEQPLEEAKLGDSSQLRVGQWAIAIGDPFGLEKTFTVGVVSGLGRSRFPGPLRRVRYQDFIQTDASINPGNSGGPLLNIEGEVIGINTFIQAAGSGVGFAIPINMAKEVYNQLVEHGEVIRGFLGVGINDLDEGLAAALKVPDLKGALIEKVYEDTPAEKAGLRHGDVVRKVNDEEIEDSKMLQNIISHLRPGEEVKITLLRKGKEQSFDVELMKFPEQVAVAEKVEKQKNLLGLTVGPLPEPLREEGAKGVVVQSVDTDGPADEAGLVKGDVILEIDMEEVSTVEDFQNIVAQLEPGKWVSFYLRRGEQILYRALKIPSEG